MTDEWHSIREFAGFRGPRVATQRPSAAAERDETSGIPAEGRAPLSAADRVRQRLAALKGTRPPTQAPGAGAATATKLLLASTSGNPAAQSRRESAEVKEHSGGEVLLFKCKSSRCRHTWISGRGATSSEQICKSCGASVIGVVTQSGTFCEVDPMEDHPDGEILHIELHQHAGNSLDEDELEERLTGFVLDELQFGVDFFREDGVRDYVAYRRGTGSVKEEGRDARRDVVLLSRLVALIAALCKAEFSKKMRGGEADAKLQALLRGKLKFRLLRRPERSESGGTKLTAAVDFEIALDVKERIADVADSRLLSLRAVMLEMDKKTVGKADFEPGDLHPRKLLARLISGLNWQRALTRITGREGHDRVRCLTCRFIGTDCSADLHRSREVRHSLNRLPGFLFRTCVVLGREDKGGKSWEERAASFLQGIAETRGGECLISAGTDSSQNLHLELFSQPVWLASAVDRINSYAQRSSSGPSLANLVGLGRAGKGLHVIRPAVGCKPEYDAVSDVWSFLDTFTKDITRVANTEVTSWRVRWRHEGSKGLPPCTPVSTSDLEAARTLYNGHATFKDLEEFLDFLRDFRQGGAAQAKPQPRPPRGVKDRSRSRKRELRSEERARAPRSRRARSGTPSRSRSRSAMPPPRRSPSYGRERSKEKKRKDKRR